MRWDLRAVGPDFYDTARCQYRHTARLLQPPERVFDAIAGDPAGWGHWFPGFDHSGRWLSAPPHGAGSRRAVRMAGIAYEETVLVWDPPRRFAFRLDRAGAPIAYALAEDYRIAGDPAGSTLEWTFALEPRPAMRPAMRLAPSLLGPILRRAAAHLDRYLADDPGVVEDSRGLPPGHAVGLGRDGDGGGDGPPDAGGENAGNDLLGPQVV